jgi:hypothetical protein
VGGREISGLDNPEDIVAIPGCDWAIASGLWGPTCPRPRSFFINISTHEIRPAWPDNCVLDPDRTRFGDVAPPAAWSFHGLDVIARGSVVELYQVNHAPRGGGAEGRESVEVFEIDLGRDGPSLRWRGAVLGPAWLNGNDLAALPEGGFAVTNFCYPGPEAFGMGRAGGVCGNVLEWRNADEGWSIVPGSDLNYPKGIARAPAGDAYFVAAWGLKTLVRVPLGGPPGARTELPTAGLIDNITWTPDGAMLLCVQQIEREELWWRVAAGEGLGACPFQAVRVDPVTLEATILLADDRPDFFATTALQVSEREVWVSSAHGQRILVYDLHEPAS